MKATHPTTEKTHLESDAERAARKRAAIQKLIREMGKTGRNALGLIQDTPLAREAFALGEEYRRAQSQL